MDLKTLTSDETFDEIGAAFQQFGFSFDPCRPWTEFFEVFKPPGKTDLERRMSTNLLHYKANYCRIFAGVVVLGLLCSPSSLLAVVAAAGAVALAVSFKKGEPYVRVGDARVRLNHRNRALAGASLAGLALTLFGSFLWVLITLSVALLLPLTHMALRPRSFAAKYNVATDEVRSLFGATNAASRPAPAAPLAPHRPGTPPRAATPADGTPRVGRRRSARGRRHRRLAPRARDPSEGSVLRRRRPLERRKIPTAGR